jgi:hypothetical protein
MGIEMMKDFLLWVIAIAYAILFIWFLVFMLAKDLIRRFHGRWFRLSGESFDIIHYSGMAIFKIGIILFALVPYISLCLIK